MSQEDSNYILTEEYIDDGYSGTNFDRLGFHKLIEDINDKKNKYGNSKRFI